MTASSLLVEPAFATQPVSRGTLGPEVADISRMAGFDPDPEQQMALDALFAFDAAGRSAAFEFAVVCSRQNMKTGLFKMAVLGWLFVTEQRLIVWSAHEMKTTKEAFRDLENLIAGCPALKGRLASGPSEGIHRGNGEESIELASGQRVMFKARTNGGGRGLTGDKVILDEAFALEPSHMASLMPTLSAVPDPQVVYGSSAGLAKSEVLRGIRDRGRVGGRRLAYFEWCAPPHTCSADDCEHKLGTEGCALDDPIMWQRANPAMGRRITQDYILAEREAFAAMPLEFARERLGWWDAPASDAGEVPIEVPVWSAARDEESKIAGPVALTLTVSDDGSSWSCIGAAGLREDGLLHVELVDNRRGTGWVPAELARLATEHRASVVVGKATAAGGLIPDIEAEGVDVVPAGPQEIAQASVRFAADVREGKIRHIGQPAVDMAVERARSVTRGDLFRFIGVSGADISPLNALALAAWGVTHADTAEILESVW